MGKPTSPHILAAIRRTLKNYAAGLRDGSVETLKRAFHPNAIVSGYIGRESFVKDAPFLYEFVNEASSQAAVKSDPPPAPVIRSIQVFGGAAIVLLREKSYIGVDYDTSLHLIRQQGGKWWIVSKLFNGTPKK